MSQFDNEYTVLDIIGSGAFADVYKIKHKEYGYVRALKKSKATVTNKDSKAFKTFVKECSYLLNIGNGCHPNIVRIYHPQMLDNHAIVEMDYVKGETLFKYIDRLKYVEIDEIYNFIRDISSALAYCHEDIYQFLIDPNEDNIELDPNDGSKFIISEKQKEELITKYRVIHNDLHSNNIMRRDYDGMYMLLDFGLAIQDGHAVKSSSRNDGAYEYKAPEKWENENIISTETDIYGLGILMYEMLTGRVPFIFDINNNSQLKSMNDIYSCHKSSTPPAIEPLRKKAFEETHPGQEYKKDYPEWLEKMILKCLSKAPKDRYTNAKVLYNEFLSELKNITNSDNNEINAELEKLSSENKELYKSIDNISRQHKSISEENTRITTNYKELFKENTHYKEANKKLISENNAIQTELTSLKSKLKQSQSDSSKLIDNLNKQIEEKNRIIDSQKKEIASNKLKNKETQKNTIQTNEKISSRDLFAKGRNYADKQDYATAFEYFLQAANMDLGEAQFNVGYYYYYGKGVANNNSKAIEWFTRAANNGISQAKKALESIKKK